MLEYTDPEVQDALTEAFCLGYQQALEDAARRADNIETAAMMFRMKLQESVEFVELVKRYTPSGDTDNLQALLEEPDNETDA